MKHIFILILLLAASICYSQFNDSGDDYYIVYNVGEDMVTDNYEVYIMNMDGTGKRNLTNAAGVEWSYTAWDDNIYYISDIDTAHRFYFLWEMKPDGTGKRRINDFRLADSWHGVRNSGNEFIVRPQSKDYRGFYLIDSKGEILSEVLADTNRKTDVVFSPDGKKIAYRQYTDEGTDELYTANADGSDPKRLTFFPADDPMKKEYSYHAGPPRWHPGGEFISYQSIKGGKYRLYGVSPEGGESWVIYENDLDAGWHDWSPDGKWLAVEMFDNAQEQFNIYLLNWETKELKQLTNNEKRFMHAPVFVKKK